MKYPKQVGKRSALRCSVIPGTQCSTKTTETKHYRRLFKRRNAQKDDGCQKHKQLLREVVFIGDRLDNKGSGKLWKVLDVSLKELQVGFEQKSDVTWDFGGSLC